MPPKKDKFEAFEEADGD
jgi:hypothetical protein